MLVASAASSTFTYKATCTGNNTVPPVSSKATGSVSIRLINQSYASGFFYATNINQMTMAHLHAGAVGKNGPIIGWAFNSTYGPISGSIKASFTFNPSLNNVSSLLAAGLVYFNIHTTAHPDGELRGQLKSTSSPLGGILGDTSPLPAGPYNQTCVECTMNWVTLTCSCEYEHTYALGTHRSSSLDTSLCVQPPDVSTVNGYLACPYQQMPAGSYAATCDGCAFAMDGHLLQCNCKDGPNKVKYAEQLDTNTCRQPPDVSNRNGKLYCQVS